MPNPENLIPFAKGKDPRRNTDGRSRKSVTEYLKEIGASREVSFNIIITDNDGKKTERKGKITAKGKTETINQLIAVQLASKAARGDMKAMQEIMDRTEGKPKQTIDMGGIFEGGVLTVGYGDKDAED